MEKTITIASTQVYCEGAGQSTIVMLHGWPDTHESWRQQIDYFKADYVCVSFTMPGFSKDDHSNYSVNDVVERIREIVDAVSPSDKVILLAHDWGCVFGYEYAMRYSDRVEKMIGMDVGDALSQDLQRSFSVTQKLMVFTYQVILAISYVGRKSIGPAIVRMMIKGLQVKSKRGDVHAGMGMPYAMRWFGMNGGLTNLLPVEPSFPFYYAYATQKPMMFHSPQWLRKLLQSPENKVQPFDCGHWIMIDKADEFNTSVEKWLNKK